jgi:catalase
MASLPPAPPLAAAVKDVAPSPALQTIGKMKHTLAGCAGEEGRRRHCSG